MKILFLLKKNLIYGSYHSVIAKSGLLNSARITAGQLEKYLNVNTSIEVCVDANEIDKFLHKHKPSLCVIEAIWVTPEKMFELVRLHKRVTFVILIHSEVPFLAMEGNAIKWIYEYNDIDRVYPSFNSETTNNNFRELGIFDYYLPNIYEDVEVKKEKKKRPNGVIDIASFGAIRPFKNQLIQAMAAIAFADKNSFNLRFHMNTSRAEQGGESVLKNIRALFSNSFHQFIEHGWAERDKFLELVSTMDCGLQVSFSESFNIVAADFVQENVPIVVSSTIDWMPDSQKCSTEEMDEIIDRIEYSIRHKPEVAKKSVKSLTKYNKRSLEVWGEFLRNC